MLLIHVASRCCLQFNTTTYIWPACRCQSRVSLGVSGCTPGTQYDWCRKLSAPIGPLLPGSSSTDIQLAALALRWDCVSPHIILPKLPPVCSVVWYGTQHLHLDSCSLLAKCPQLQVEHCGVRLHSCRLVQHLSAHGTNMPGHKKTSQGHTLGPRGRVQPQLVWLRKLQPLCSHVAAWARMAYVPMQTRQWGTAVGPPDPKPAANKQLVLGKEAPLWSSTAWCARERTLHSIHAPMALEL